MSKRSLPSVQDILTAPDPSSLLMAAFAYGTDYEVWPKVEETLEARSKEAASVLRSSWNSTPDLQPFFVDALWVVSAVATGPSLIALTTILMALLAVPDRPGFVKDLQGTLDPDLLQQFQLIADKNAMLKKIRMLNTETHYKQHKFNLMQEQSEGYAKLLSLLWDTTNSNDLTTLRVTRIIGKFDLDPNRVLDLMLDCLEHATTEERQQKLLTILQDAFPKHVVPPLLVFKLANYERRKEPTPPTLYAMICSLAEQDWLDLTTLAPAAMAQIHAAHSIYLQLEKKKLSKMASISLGGPQDPNKQEVELSQKLDAAIASLTNTNVLIGLLTVLVDKRKWDLCLSLVSTLEDWTQICSLLPSTIGHMLNIIVGEHMQAMCDKRIQTPMLIPKLPAKPAVLALPEASTLDEFIAACSLPLQALSGSNCLKPALYAQVCRLTKTLLLLETQPILLTSPTTYGFFTSFLVPSLSVLPPNPALSCDLWFVLELLPFSTRYKLYKDWTGPGLERAGMMGGLKSMVRVQAEMIAGKETRHTLKRLTDRNVGDMGRQVSKQTHSNPLVVFMTILNQIESYDNLIQMMVEIVRFVTPLSMDILGYCILTRLSGSGINRNRLKDDGVNVSQWLSSLESFTGAFYKKCPDVEFRGIFLYLIHQLKAGQVLELGVLRTLIKDAGGYSYADYSPISSLSAAQLASRAGSQLLKKETYAFGVVEHVNMRASNRIRSVLQSDNIGIQILILLAQVRGKLVFEKSGKTEHVKLIGNLFDSCQTLTSVLLEFLTTDDIEGERSALSKYAASLPSLKSLLQDYGMDGPSAWMLYRPVIQLDYQSRAKHDGKNGMTKIKENYKDRAEVIKSVLPSSVLMDLTPSLVDLFFSFSLYDVTFPEESYNVALSRLKRAEEALLQKQRQKNPGPDKHFTREDDMELGRIRKVVSSLPEDMTEQSKIRASCLGKMQREGSGLFQSKIVSIAAVQAFFTYCIFPRCTLGPEDAMYCAHFAHLLHVHNISGFSYMHYVDELMDVVECSLYSTTEGEASSIAVMLLETWKVISRWRYNEQAFENEVDGKPGSFMVHDGNGASPVTYPKYKILYNRWHAALGKAFLGCLQSTEYIHLRSCFLVLNRVVDEFPTRPVLGQKLMNAMSPLLTHRLQDIASAAQSYNALLTQARGSGVWQEEDAATAIARENEEKAAQLQRQKKAKEQLADMELEREAIDKELRDNLGDDSRGRRDNGRRDGRGPPRDGPRDGPREDRRLNPGVPTFEPRIRDEQTESGGRSLNFTAPPSDARPRNDQKDRNIRSREVDQGDRRDGDGSKHTAKGQVNEQASRGRDERAQPSSSSRITENTAPAASFSQPRPRNTEETATTSGSLEGRWERGGGVSANQNLKRDHSPNRSDDPAKKQKIGEREEEPASHAAVQFNVGRSDPIIRGRTGGGRGGSGGQRRGQGRRI